MWVEKGEMQRALRASFHLFTDSWIIILPWGWRLNWKRTKRRDLQDSRKLASFTKTQARNCSLILSVEEGSPAFLACTAPFLLENQVLTSPLVHRPETSNRVGQCWMKGWVTLCTLLGRHWKQSLWKQRKQRGLTWLNSLSSGGQLDNGSECLMSFARGMESSSIYIFNKFEQMKPSN